MGLPGTEAIRTLQSGARKAKRGAELIAAEFDGVQAGILRLVERRGSALTALARHYLPSFDNRHIAAVFDDARDELERLQYRQQMKVDELGHSIDALVKRRADHEAELDTINRDLEVKVGERTRLQAKLAEMLAADEHFQDLTNEVARTTARLERDEDRVSELHEEAGLKLPAYERSRLFIYLLERGFGSSTYSAGGFTRRMDKMVADLIDWPTAKEGFDFLRTMPAVVESEVERRKAVFETRVAELHEIESETSKRLGLPALMAAGEALGHRREEVLHLLEVTRDLEARARDELAAVQSATGQFHADALQKLRQYLEGLSTASLAAHASRTADPTDDKLVVEIEATDREAAELRRRSAELATQRETSDHRAIELQQLVDELRRRECDSVRCSIETTTLSDFEKRVDAIAEGKEEVAALRSDLERNLRFAAAYLPKGLRAQSPLMQQAGTGGSFPWWMLQAMGAVADIALRGAMARGIGRHFSSGATIGGDPGGGSPPSAGATGRGGRFTRGAGF